jgi:hypothetical protein
MSELVSLNDKYFTHFSLFVDSNLLLVTKLSRVRIEVNQIELHSKDIKLFETLAQNYRNSLKSISIRADYYLNENETNFLMQRMVYLKPLTELELWLKLGRNSVQVFVENLKAISFYCKQL